MLKNFRRQIDRIDDEFLILLKRRFQLSKKVSKYKMCNNIPVMDPSREDEILTRLAAKARTMDIGESFSRRFYELVLSQSKLLQEEYMNEQKLKNKN